MSEDDFWSRWLRRRSWWPFTRSWMFEDIEDIFREMEDFMAKELGELSEKAPKELVRERTLPSGAKVKQWGPFVYGLPNATLLTSLALNIILFNNITSIVLPLAAAKLTKKI